ncbi:uncharacterized protein PV09_05412 [Verruconis gallopava]|uniref:Impact N-terminal domain-containing protein n=1 Tax=Verruconis gallopava TaxID=253628 RepID=A0A0D2A9C3_9PEZI|nr:uncharacterized protein PV09_05412 [Verruconis gallopava]KIW03185.1 hypothetical protein PV09_05412 [Verruconis gallopava]
MPPKRPVPSDDSVVTPAKVFISESIHDRKSVFVGYFAPDHVTPKDLQARDDVKSASHRVVAWRLPSNQKTLFSSSRPIFKSGHDDDGEQWAGRKIENLMEQLDIQGVIMVARWYGGALLGPVRFKHIEDVARGAVDAWRSEINGGPLKKSRLDSEAGAAVGATASNQTMRPEELQRRKKEIIETLRRRDESIVTLRQLLEEKRGVNKPKSSAGRGNASPSTSVNYESMPYNRLHALENARDMTIGFLLKEIDKAEAEAKIRKEEETQKQEQTEAALRAEEKEELELDEAWAEMESALNAVNASKHDT